VRSIQSIVMTILLLLSFCSVLEAFGGVPPSLTLFTPQIDGLTVTINGVTMPGMSGTSITRIHWDWGDGYSEDHWFANSHLYPNNGTYIITVTSYQSDGLTTTKARVVSLGVPPKNPILLLVNETIYPSIANRISVFRQDLSFDGYDAIVSLLSNGLDARQIKDIIKSYYTENNVTGCILIGDIKAAYTEFRTEDSSSVCISLDAADMYYMDLDGYWENVTHPDFYEHRPPGDTRQVVLYDSCQTFYDEYIVYLNESKKWDYSTIENKVQYKAEIWVSRIMGHNLAVSGKNETDIINEFLYWNHAFRTERKRIEDRVYLLNAIGSGYNDQNMNYSSIFDSVVKKEYVTKNDYLNCLRNPNGSKLTYLTAHSGPQIHCLYDANLMVDELAGSNKTSVFYILNACSSCRWDQYVSSPANPDYLGGTYVFDKSESDYGLGAIGFTGVGGFNWLEFFTDYLNTNPYGSYGEAYKYWFNENLMRIFTAWNYVYLGDPIIGPSSPRLVRNVDTGLRYEKIQEAINAPETQNGHTIVIGAGTYYENVVVNKTISLFGENREKTVIDGKGAGNSISVIANGVLISELTATNCGDSYPNSGIFLNMVEDAIVTCCNVSYNRGHGIFIMWGTNNSLLNNVIEYNVQPGIRVDGTAAHALIANNTIENNQPDGIFLYSAYHVLIEKNTILNNKQCGITPQGGSTNITIRHNFVLNNGWHGIFFVGSTASLIEANILAKNGLSGLGFVGSSDHNSISGNTVEGNSRGISFYESSNNSIIHNNFWNNASQVDTYNSVNSWDSGYPSGGNYWSDYTGIDVNGDGIGDSPYVIDGDNQDNYPFMNRIPYECGTIHIRGDGNVDPPEAPIWREGDLYTLMVNIISDADGIVIERNNMMLDGAGYTLQGPENGTGINLSGTNNVTIKNTHIKDFVTGIEVSFSNYNSISGNNITANNEYGIVLVFSSSNSISGNNITNSGYGILLGSSSSNSIFHNNFINNAQQAYSIDSVNVWDDGYPSGGNYWSDYTSTDADHDGIGDTPYVIDGLNQDNYPLMQPFTKIQIPGDINHDGIVDIFDIVIVALEFGHPPPPIVDLRADVNKDGLVDIFDIVVVALHFGETG